MNRNDKKKSIAKEIILFIWSITKEIIPIIMLFPAPVFFIYAAYSNTGVEETLISVLLFGFFSGGMSNILITGLLVAIVNEEGLTKDPLRKLSWEDFMFISSIAVSAIIFTSMTFLDIAIKASIITGSFALLSSAFAYHFFAEVSHLKYHDI